MINYSVSFYRPGKPLAYSYIRGSDLFDALIRFAGRRRYKVLRSRIDDLGSRVLLHAQLVRKSDSATVCVEQDDSND